MVDKKYIEVVEVQGSEVINKYLKHGWVLLETCSGNTSDGAGYMFCMLGCPEGIEPKHFTYDLPEFL